MVTLANSLPAQQGEGFLGFLPAIPIGFIVLAAIISPVVLIILISIFSAPRTFKVPGLFLGSLILIFSILIVNFAMIGLLLMYVVPA